MGRRGVVSDENSPKSKRAYMRFGGLLKSCFVEQWKAFGGNPS